MKNTLALNKSGMQRTRRAEAGQCFLLLSPMIIGFFALSVYPICWAVRLAWYFYEGAVTEMRFVGWENFINVFADDMYWKTWVTTFKFAFAKLPIELPLAMLLAVLVNKKLKGVGFFRAMYFLPHIISVAIVGLIFSNLFDYFGVINAWLVKSGIINERIDWFANGNTAFSVLVAGDIWKSFGINVLYFLAALQNVPEELYESARLDGAKRGTIFFKITLPLMAPVLQTVLLLAINGSLQTNDFVLVSTGGAPAGETFTVAAYMTKTFAPGFASGVVNLGYGCAQSIVTSVLLMITAVVYNKLSSRAKNLY